MGGTVIWVLQMRSGEWRSAGICECVPMDVFVEYQIAVFIDQKTSIIFHPFIEFLRASLEVVLYDFSNESIFRYLRSGLSGITAEEVDRIENYCIAAGIRGYKKWSEMFCYRPKAYTEESLAGINEIREKIAEQFSSFYPALKQKNITVKRADTKLLPVHL